MRIAITADPELPIPPRLYGGIERIIDLLVRGLEVRGHEVTLFAHPDSNSAGRLVPLVGKSSLSTKDTARNAFLIACHVLTGRFDLVHSFSRLAYLLPLLPLPIPKLMTYQRAITPRSIGLGHLVSRGTLHFCAISRHLTAEVSNLGDWHLVYNGVAIESYDFSPTVAEDAPLVFLGRVEPIKGPDLAIDVAQQVGVPLIIAGNVPPEHGRFFDEKIRQHLDGRTVVYMGPVDDRQKNELLGRARALLMPILWEEPFGIVMAEALACGTPVIGLKRGAVPEVVEDGVTGYVCHDFEGLVEAVSRLPRIARVACRQRAEDLFSGQTVVEGYLAIYRQLQSSAGGRGT